MPDEGLRPKDLDALKNLAEGTHPDGTVRSETESVLDQMNRPLDADSVHNFETFPPIDQANRPLDIDSVHNFETFPPIDPPATTEATTGDPPYNPVLDRLEQNPDFPRSDGMGLGKPGDLEYTPTPPPPIEPAWQGAGPDRMGFTPKDLEYKQTASTTFYPGDTEALMARAAPSGLMRVPPLAIWGTVGALLAVSAGLFFSGSRGDTAAVSSGPKDAVAAAPKAAVATGAPAKGVFEYRILAFAMRDQGIFLNYSMSAVASSSSGATRYTTQQMLTYTWDVQLACGTYKTSFDSIDVDFYTLDARGRMVRCPESAAPKVHLTLKDRWGRSFERSYTGLVAGSVGDPISVVQEGDTSASAAAVSSATAAATAAAAAPQSAAATAAPTGSGLPMSFAGSGIMLASALALSYVGIKQRQQPKITIPEEMRQRLVQDIPTPPVDVRSIGDRLFSRTFNGPRISPPPPTAVTPDEIHDQIIGDIPGTVPIVDVPKLPFDTVYDVITGPTAADPPPPVGGPMVDLSQPPPPVSTPPPTPHTPGVNFRNLRGTFGATASATSDGTSTAPVSITAVPVINYKLDGGIDSPPPPETPDQMRERLLNDGPNEGMNRIDGIPDSIPDPEPEPPEEVM